MHFDTGELLNPVGEIDPLQIPLASRFPDVSGKVLGLLDNMKVNCEFFLDLRGPD
jgi:hypothetical protein